MTDQVVIEFPELTKEQYDLILELRNRIIVKLWKSDERITLPLKWEGTRIGSPVTFWFDFPEKIGLERVAQRV